MKKLIALFVGAVALSLFAAATAEEKSEKGGTVTKTGKITCAKCTLSISDKCEHVLVVKEDGKDVNYFVDDKNKDHKKVCPPGTELEAKVTGKLVEKDGKKTLQSAKVEFKK